MENEKVLRAVILHLGLGDTTGFYYYLKFLPPQAANAIERGFYERLKKDGKVEAACKAAKRVAKNFVGKI